MKLSQILSITLSGLITLISAAAVQGQDTPNDVAEQIHDVGDAAGGAAEAIGETMEDVAEQVGEVSAEFSAQLEKWMDEHSENLKGWTDEYGQDWQSWAQQLQGRTEKWAQSQNRQWGRWSKHYEAEMKALTGELDRDDLSAEDVGKLIDKNLDMLSKMPIGQMIEEGIKEATGGLKSAPLESLDGLKDIAGEAYEDSFEAAEEVASTGIAAAMQNRDKLNKLMDKLQVEYNQKSEQLNEAFQQQMKQLDSLAKEVENEIQNQKQAESHTETDK